MPFIAPFAGGIWNTLWDLDFVGAIVGGIGLVLVVVAGRSCAARRSATCRFSSASGEMDDVATNLNDIVDSAAPGEKRTGTAPPTII